MFEPLAALSPPSLKRRQILDAAADLFIAQGYGAVSMDTIARGAGVSKATLYAHFASKDRLFATIIEDACRRNMIDAGLLPDPSTPLATALLAVAHRLLGLMLEPRALGLHQIVVAESLRFPELGRAFYENGPARVRTWLANWFEAREASGALMLSSAEIAAEQFVGMLRAGPCLRATLGIMPTPAEIDRAAVAATETFLRAFTRQPKAEGEAAETRSDPGR